MVSDMWQLLSLSLRVDATNLLKGTKCQNIICDLNLKGSCCFEGNIYNIFYHIKVIENIFIKYIN